MDEIAAPERLPPETEPASRHRSLKLSVISAEDGQLLVVISNSNAAAAYRAEAGWPEKFKQNLDEGLFG
jgi:hypothetical protein